MLGSSLTGRGSTQSLAFSRLTMRALTRKLAASTAGAVPVGSRRIWAFPVLQIPFAATVQLALVGVPAAARVVTASAVLTATAATNVAKRETLSTHATIGMIP
jgi:hypothetical protein